MYCDSAYDIIRIYFRTTLSTVTGGCHAVVRRPQSVRGVQGREDKDWIKAGTEGMKRKEDNGEEKCSGIRKREASGELQISSLGTLEKVWIWEN